MKKNVIKKEDFIDLYNTYSIKELCFMFGCTAPTIYKRIEELGINKKGQGKGKRTRSKLIIEE